jgi:5-methylcytosine-specific restriction endonuclease McrA
VKRCPHCGGLFASGFAQHRARCYAQRRDREGDGRPSYSSSARWKRIRAQVIERDGGRCRACGSTEDLQAAHLDHDWTLDAGAPVVTSEILARIVTLCQTCHKAYDAGRLTLSTL